MNRFIKILIALAILFILPHFSYAQKNPQLNLIGGIAAAHGLMTDWIQYIHKDSEGFMWFTFDDGFNRWDGNMAKQFPMFLDDTTLSSSYRFCRPILEDRKGNFFIGTLANGLIKLNRQTDEYFRYVHNASDPGSIACDSIHELLLDDDGSIWIGSYNVGLSWFNPETEIFENYRVNTKGISNKSNNIRSLYLDNTGIFWVGTGSGLFQFDKAGKGYKPIKTGLVFPENTNSFECILEDTHGNMWFGTRWGLLKYTRDRRNWEHIGTDNPDKPGSKHDAYIHCIEEYSMGSRHQIWIGTEAGLKVYDVNAQALTHFNSKNGYPVVTNTGPVQYLYKDDENILWAALEGVTLIDLKDLPFQKTEMPSYPDSIEYVPASCFYEDENKHLWVATLFDGLYEYNECLEFIDNHQIPSSDPQTISKGFDNGFLQIYSDRNERLWMLTGPTGLCLFDKDLHTFHPIELDIGKYFPTEILLDSQDNIWLATNDGLIVGQLTNDSRIKCYFLKDPQLPKVKIKDILYDTQSRLWVLTENDGVYTLTPEQIDSMKFDRYLHRDYKFKQTDEYNAASVLEDDWGNIWFMSQHALFKLDNSLDSIVPVDHFNNNNFQKIYSFTRDRNGIFWFIWRYGMIYYNPGDTTQDKIFVQSMYDGIPFTYLMRNSFFYGSRDYLYCGGQATISRGFFRFHLDSIKGPNKKIPPVVIRDFKVKNQALTLDSNISHTKHIELDYTQNFFSFEFAALNYRNPAANNYAYMLEGVDEDWVYCGVQMSANYTGVSPGTYIFRAKGTNNHGYWNDEGASIFISIAPPPWRTWWAYTFYGLAFVALLLALRWYDLKRQRLKQSLKLEQVEKDKLGELNRLKSNFFANISHEFRTPLTLIMGPLDKLIKRNIDDDCQKDLGIMQRNAQRLQELINQLLSISKLESGKERLQASKLNIVQLVKWYTQSFESLARQKNIDLVFESDQEEIMLWVDRDKVEKILYNLLSNAFKFTSAGGSITVEVGYKIPDARYQMQDARLKTQDSGHRSQVTDQGVCISVTDTGTGIDEDRLPHIFDRFYQADNAYKADSEGTGIGLALTKELVELHHGEISVKSERGAGSRFYVYLPFGKEHLSEDEISESTIENLELTTDNLELTTENIELTTDSHPGIDPDSEKPIILIVEDNLDMRAYIRDYLEPDYQVIEAIDGKEGLEKAIQHIPDLVISDVMMPKMDGYQFCHALKSDGRTSHIPVIILTAKASQESKMEGLETGADDFMVKPFDADELLVRVRNMVEQRKRWREQFQKKFNKSDFTPFPQLLESSINSMDEQFLQEGFKIVEKHLDDTEYNVEQFLADMAMSKVQLYRKLKGLLNISAIEFIRSIRLGHAARMIEEKSDNIAQIAYAVGFNNPSYFAECFKKQFGVSPSEFSKM